MECNDKAIIDVSRGDNGDTNYLGSWEDSMYRRIEAVSDLV